MAPPSRMPKSSLQLIVIHSTRCCLHNWTRACQGAQSDQQCFHKADESARRSKWRVRKNNTSKEAIQRPRSAKNQMTRGVWDCFLHSCCCMLRCCCHSDSFLDLRPFLPSSLPPALPPSLPSFLSCFICVSFAFLALHLSFLFTPPLP